MTKDTPSSPELEQQLMRWLPTQRWFSAKNRTIESVRIVQRTPLLAESDVDADHIVVVVELDGAPPLRCQVPLGYRARLPDGIGEYALSRSAYDGLRDPVVVDRYATTFAAAGQIGPIRFRRVPGAVVDIRARARVLGAEQSNTSVVFGEQLLLKFFRQVEPGVNPDVELHRALGEAGCEYVAPLLGWVEAGLGGEQVTLAMAQQFVANAADGWDMALTSVRDLFAEADLHAAEVGTDFAGEAERLGAAVAHVHAALATRLGSSEQEIGSTVIAAMRRSLDATVLMVPQLAPYRAAIASVYDAAAATGPTTVQRIHSDLHLGQVLRTPARWLLIDFEGEPMKPIAERQRPDSPLRDVAGMLRSFDYAGHQPLGSDDLPGASQRLFRATEWADRNGAAFCEGYASVSGSDPRDRLALLRAYELDKAVYETAYEARHRPDWIHLPLRAIARLTSGSRVARG